MNRTKSVGIQYAALPYRIVGRRLEVLLITSRETRRWVIPKGWPMSGLKPHQTAAVEAAEEAGVEGEIEATAIGSYRYLKRIKDGMTIPTQVIVFPLLVQKQADHWREQDQRQVHWLAYRQAAARVTEPNLKRLIRELGDTRGPRLLPSASRLGRWVDATFFQLRRWA